MKPHKETIKQETKTCKSCLKEIPKAATKCSGCGTKQGTSPCCTIPLAFGLFIIFLSALGTSLGQMSGNTHNETVERTEATEDEAFIISKHFVEATLNSPSTAEFPSGMFASDYYRVSKDEDIYTIQSYVEAQNGFGAIIRTYYTLKIRFLGGDPLDISSWEYVDLQTQ